MILPVAVTCPSLNGSLPNGNVGVSHYTPGSKANFSCSDGYVIKVGLSWLGPGQQVSRWCQRNGTWAIPTAIQCTGNQDASFCSLHLSPKGQGKAALSTSPVPELFYIVAPHWHELSLFLKFVVAKLPLRILFWYVCLYVCRYRYLVRSV